MKEEEEEKLVRFATLTKQMEAAVVVPDVVQQAPNLPLLAHHRCGHAFQKKCAMNQSSSAEP